MIASLIERIRRNHALEHATLNLVSREYPGAQLVGFSGPLGFTIYTSLTAKEIVPAAMEALKRLKTGDQHLRVHHNCGTNLVVTATLTSLMTLIGLKGKRKLSFWEAVERFPHIIVLNALALLVSPVLGEWVQVHVTTNPHVANVEIASVFTDYHSGLQRIRVHTRQP